MFCAQAVWAQDADAADTSIGASTDIAENITEDIAVDTSVSALADIAEDVTADVPLDTPAGLAAIDDDDDDDELIFAEIALDTSTVVKPELIRREHDYRRQTRLAIVMMIFIAAALSTSQSWNPR
jgi:hypothetical protein